jgi:hypothetical protein
MPIYLQGKAETLKVRKAWNDIFQILIVNNDQPSYPLKLMEKKNLPR